MTKEEFISNDMFDVIITIRSVANVLDKVAEAPITEGQAAAILRVTICRLSELRKLLMTESEKIEELCPF